MPPLGKKSKFYIETTMEDSSSKDPTAMQLSEDSDKIVETPKQTPKNKTSPEALYDPDNTPKKPNKTAKTKASVTPSDKPDNTSSRREDLAPRTVTTPLRAAKTPSKKTHTLAPAARRTPKTPKPRPDSTSLTPTPNPPRMRSTSAAITLLPPPPRKTPSTPMRRYYTIPTPPLPDPTPYTLSNTDHTALQLCEAIIGMTWPEDWYLTFLDTLARELESNNAPYFIVPGPFPPGAYPLLSEAARRAGVEEVAAGVAGGFYWRMMEEEEAGGEGRGYDVLRVGDFERAVEGVKRVGAKKVPFREDGGKEGGLVMGGWIGPVGRWKDEVDGTGEAEEEGGKTKAGKKTAKAKKTNVQNGMKGAKGKGTEEMSPARKRALSRVRDSYDSDDDEILDDPLPTTSAPVMRHRSNVVVVLSDEERPERRSYTQITHTASADNQTMEEPQPEISQRESEEAPALNYGVEIFEEEMEYLLSTTATAYENNMDTMSGRSEITMEGIDTQTYGDFDEEEVQLAEQLLQNIQDRSSMSLDPPQTVPTPAPFASNPEEEALLDALRDDHKNELFIDLMSSFHTDPDPSPTLTNTQTAETLITAAWGPNWRTTFNTHFTSVFTPELATFRCSPRLTDEALASIALFAGKVSIENMATRIADRVYLRWLADRAAGGQVWGEVEVRGGDVDEGYFARAMSVGGL